MSKHTPGPWESFKDDDDGIYEIGHRRCSAGTRVVAEVDFDFSARTRREQHANARLIARCPEMYSLLERIYTECDERDEGKGGRFSVELMEELRRFVEEMQK